MWGVLSWDDLIKKYDLLIQAGKAYLVVEELKKIPSNKIPRSFAVAMADIARRIQQFDLGLLILRPYVISEIPSVKPEPNELLIYSSLLIRIGAFDEAQIRLSVLKQTHAVAFLHLAFADITQWNYRKAISHLELFLSSNALDPYQNAIANVNLVACYINLAHWGKAKILIDKLLPEYKKNNWSLLVNNLLELSSLLILETAESPSELLRAEAKINESLDLLKSGGSEYQKLFLLKWQAVVKIKTSGMTEDNKENLLSVRNKASELKHWETIRDCDFYFAVFSGNKELAIKLIYGTPFRSFRKKVLRYFPELKVPKEYIWSEEKTTFQIDLYSGKDLDGNLVIKPNSVTHKLLTILSLDFYRPIPMGTLFSRLHPEEYYNPITTPIRMSKAIQRLREILKNTKSGFEVKKINQSYKLVKLLNTSSGIKLRRDRDNKFVDVKYELNMYRLGILKNKWPNRTFSSQQAAQYLGLSKRSTVTLLSWAYRNAKLFRSGSSRDITYLFSI